MEKRFSEWIKIKENLHNMGRMPYIREGEVWWAALGENIGVEISGKGDGFSRPVLVMKKINRYCFMAIPLTSQNKSGPWYVDFVFKDKKEIVVIIQAEIMSTSRLYRKMGQIPVSDLDKVRARFHHIFS